MNSSKEIEKNNDWQRKRTTKDDTKTKKNERRK